MTARALILMALVFSVSCDAETPTTASDAHVQEVVEWRQWRLDRLKAPTGYLNLAGLHWLENGTVTFGSADANDIVLPASAPAVMGELVVTDDGVTMRTCDGAGVLVDGQPVSEIFMVDDTMESPVTATQGELAWMIIQRAGRFAFRVRDFNHPAIESFPPLEYYDIDPALRVVASFEPFDEPTIANVGTVIEGLGYHPQVPGTVTFTIAGEAQNLEGYAVGDELFFVFADRTSGRETYPAGRFLYAPWPKGGGETVLDFNKAYNPPCAFNDFSTCPVASPRNRMNVRVEAGEKFDPDVHFTPGKTH